MDTKQTRSARLRALTECAVMLALAIVLSLLRYQMPMGGEITPASMLPIFVVGLKYGRRAGFSTAFAYALAQLFIGLIAGNVFPYLEGGFEIVMCVLFDYLLPFTLLGMTAFFRRGAIGPYVGIVAACLARFACHFVSGVVIWGKWAENVSPAVYSLFYNGGFLLPEMILCIAVAVLLFEVPKTRELIGLPAKDARPPQDENPGDDADPR